MQDRIQPAFFSKTYDEAMDLLEEARDYIAFEEKIDRQNIGIAERLKVILETTRLTSRMTHVMAWLLARRAVQVGEITAEDVRAEEYRLDRRPSLIGNDAGAHKGLPEKLVQLMERSHGLYTRISRLDEVEAPDAIEAASGEISPTLH